MDSPQTGYVKLRLKLARGKLRVARLLHKNEEYRDAISRTYYSIYYAANIWTASKQVFNARASGIF